MDLCKKDLQKFFKRLRKSHSSGGAFNGKRLKYYAVGEYGGNSFRPHFHVILFNSELNLLIGKKEGNAAKRGMIPLDGKIQFQCKDWWFGHITVGRVSEASVGYTLKYISKPSKIPLHRNDDRVKEFSCMSKGLGDNYIYSYYPYCEQWLHRSPKGVWSVKVVEKNLKVLDRNAVDWHKADLENRMYVNLKDGKKCTMPRYFKDKLYNDSERRIVADANQVRIKEKLSKEFELHTSKSLSDERLTRTQGIEAAYRNQQNNPSKKI